MRSFVLPIRVIAIAAFEAARIHGEEPADVFDNSKASRARWLAIESVRRIFPTSSQVSIARNFGVEGDAKAVSIRMQNARLANWFRDEDAALIAARLAPQSRIEPCDEPRVEIQEDLVARVSFKPRQRGTPITVVRNVTAALLGDPPAGRREQIAAIKGVGPNGGYEHQRRMTETRESRLALPRIGGGE